MPPRALISKVALVPLALLFLGLSGCGLKHATANLVKGKQLFIQKCGVCHTLSHASTKGSIGPNLDNAFRQDRKDGIKSTSIQGFVDGWIEYPNTQGVMPQGIFRGQDAQDVAAYVAFVASEPGQDSGALLSAVKVTVPVTAAAGKTVFTGVGGCGACHTLAAAGTNGTVGPDLTARLAKDCADPASQKARGASLTQCITTAIVKPYAYLPPPYKAGIMPSNFSQTLSPTQVKALVKFISSVTH